MISRNHTTTPILLFPYQTTPQNGPLILLPSNLSTAKGVPRLLMMSLKGSCQQRSWLKRRLFLQNAVINPYEEQLQRKPVRPTLNLFATRADDLRNLQLLPLLSIRDPSNPSACRLPKPSIWSIRGPVYLKTGSRLKSYLISRKLGSMLIRKAFKS